MQNELKGIYDHIGPSKFDSKIIVHPDEIEELIKEFGEWIAMWYKTSRQNKNDPAYATAAWAQMRMTQRALVFVLKWLGGDD